MKSTTSPKRIMELKIGVAALSLCATGVLSCAALGAQRAGTAQRKGDRQRALDPTDVQKFDSCLRPCMSDDSACFSGCLTLSGETDQSVINATGPMPPVPVMQDSTATCLTVAISNAQSCADKLLANDVGISKQAFWVCTGAAARLFLRCSGVESLADDQEGDAVRFGLGLLLRLARRADTPDGFFDGVRNTRTALAQMTADTDDSSGTIAAEGSTVGSEVCFDTCSSNYRSNLQTCDADFPNNPDAHQVCVDAATEHFKDCVKACPAKAE